MSFRSYKYQFPKNKRAMQATQAEQVDKIREELIEVMEQDILTRSVPRSIHSRRYLLEEAMDLQHAIEGLFRHYSKEEVDKAYRWVLDKNRERGDYAGDKELL